MARQGAKFPQRRFVRARAPFAQNTVRPEGSYRRHVAACRYVTLIRLILLLSDDMLKALLRPAQGLRQDTRHAC